MRASGQHAQVEQLWTNTFRHTRRALQVAERQLQQQEQELHAELSQSRAAGCASAVIANVERTLQANEARVERELRALQIALHETNIDLKLRGLDALLLQYDKQLEASVAFMRALVEVLEKRSLQSKRALTGSIDYTHNALPSLPESDNSVFDAILRVAGQDSAIDRVLRELDTVLRAYERRKLWRRILFHAVRVLLFLVLLGFLIEFLLSLIQPSVLYLFAAAAVWFVDDYFIRPRLDKRLEKINREALQYTIRDFYRAQRQALYLGAALEKMMQDAQAVLAHAERSNTQEVQQA